MLEPWWTRHGASHPHAKVGGLCLRVLEKAERLRDAGLGKVKEGAGLKHNMGGKEPV